MAGDEAGRQIVLMGLDYELSVSELGDVFEASFAGSLHPRGRGGQWIVKQGSAGAETRAVQRKVGTKVDGQFDKLTTQAVMAFQRRHGLQVDGQVGAQTVAAMMGKRRAAQVKAAPMTPADRKWLMSQAAAKS